jgi:pilus assembly protein Flp/PilA
MKASRWSGKTAAVKSQTRAPMRFRRMETFMDKLIVKALTFKNDRKAVTALEYGIIAGVLGLVLITIFTSFGSKLTTLFTNIGNSI